MRDLEKLSEKALKQEYLSRDELILIYEKMPLPHLMYIADSIRRQKHQGDKVSWQIDRNVNITNVCIAGCSFCNFSCRLNEADKCYTVSIDDYSEKIEELFRTGGNQLLLQGGLHPKYGLSFYSSLFRELKSAYPELKLHALGPPEIAHIARLEKKSYRYVLEKLIESGLDSLPGAGAEILSDRVRKQLSPCKPDVRAWLEVMREAHALNLPTSATMMFGHIETVAERIEHLIMLRDLHDKRPAGTYGFLAFICWPVQSLGTRMAEEYVIKPVSSSEYVRMIAISRIALTNIDNIQASWLTVGKDTAQICLHAGANDFGSIMIEENVVSSAGADNRFDATGIQNAIREAGFEPWLRNQKYERFLTMNYER
ncbi:MAG: radical SAM protein [Tannerella sp.]|jgi:cyclic dehypoxanthinyl futalosine synthase|nr:radical SAM protein [Tannerella sp.]